MRNALLFALAIAGCLVAGAAVMAIGNPIPIGETEFFCEIARVLGLFLLGCTITVVCCLIMSDGHNLCNRDRPPPPKLCARRLWLCWLLGVPGIAMIPRGAIVMLFYKEPDPAKTTINEIVLPALCTVLGLVLSGLAICLATPKQND